MSVIVKLKTMDTITITATRKEATIVLNYKGKTYTQNAYQLVQVQGMKDVIFQMNLKYQMN